jgi:hypothetical protein
MALADHVRARATALGFSSFRITSDVGKLRMRSSTTPPTRPGSSGFGASPASLIDCRVSADIGESAKEVALVILYSIYSNPNSRESLTSAVDYVAISSLSRRFLPCFGSIFTRTRSKSNPFILSCR